MREIGAVEVGGTEYRAVWATLGWIDREAHEIESGLRELAHLGR